MKNKQLLISSFSQLLRITCFMIMLFVTDHLFAQGSLADSLKALQDNRSFDNYSFTGNTATITSGLPNFGYARATAGFISGDFKRPMEPAAYAAYALSTGGSTTLNGWKFIADLQYQRRYDSRVAWAAVNDPYTGNPFIWADSNTGKWEREQVHATIGTAIRLNKRWKAGFMIDYLIGTGARTNEPKPFYRMRDIALQPALIYQLSSTAELGIIGSATFAQEENEIGYYSNSNVLLYRLRGYGTFSRSPFVSGERKRTGTTWKAGMHYAKRWNRSRLLLHGSVAQTDEEVFEGVAQKQTTGYFTAINIEGKAKLYKGDPANGQSLEIIAQNKNGYADDMIFRAESASSIQRSLCIGLSGWKQHANKLLQWQFTPSVSFIDHTDQATYMQFTATTFGAMLGGNYRKQFNHSLAAAVQPAIGYYRNIDNSFTSRANQVIIRELIIPDFYYFSSSYWKATCGLQLELAGNNLRKAHIIGFYGDLRVSDNADLRNRIFYQLQYSILF
jgi:hypothetical protein